MNLPVLLVEVPIAGAGAVHLARLVRTAHRHRRAPEATPALDSLLVEPGTGDIDQPTAPAWGDPPPETVLPDLFVPIWRP